jgi:3-methyladenine DNA glycosylase AlkD
MAKLAISDKKADDRKFEQFFPHIKEGAKDERKYVAKAVSWALRQIGKRSPYLREKAVELAKEIEKLGTKSAKRIAREVLKELSG